MFLFKDSLGSARAGRLALRAWRVLAWFSWALAGVAGRRQSGLRAGFAIEFMARLGKLSLLGYGYFNEEIECTPQRGRVAGHGGAPLWA